MYSIIYAVIRSEIAERISVGLIFVEGEKVDRYSLLTTEVGCLAESVFTKRI